MNDSLCIGSGSSVETKELSKPKVFNTFNPYRNRRLRRWKEMTVCIAALSDIYTQNPKIIFAADRLVSAGIQFEHGVSKIGQITYNCYVMVTSNDSLESDMIFKKVQGDVAGKKLTVEDVARLFAKECQQLQHHQRQRDILSKLGLDYETYLKKSKTMSDELSKMIYSRLTSWESEFETQFIVLG